MAREAMLADRHEAAVALFQSCWQHHHDPLGKAGEISAQRLLLSPKAFREHAERALRSADFNTCGPCQAMIEAALGIDYRNRAPFDEVVSAQYIKLGCMMIAGLGSWPENSSDNPCNLLDDGDPDTERLRGLFARSLDERISTDAGDSDASNSSDNPPR